ncbi:hypothetical protein BDY17DRAFT_307524 [Neohortaea acidophila]|uniref:Citrate transporter-like domain-containing protein n=1 Tax=Neohortaea acidophila TaxID=245834 RepID=A0A6A6Q1Q6_9PEZI|nr:uncharacterized protein BDY17DRAFT_307524 [Neohortaea acidophila]KAF2485924.1 hypothetical protein BDY17DRAFT_307524 [Neohortaea acidophila]
MNFLTAPLIADLFLLACTAIGREEVEAGTYGADHIQPIYIMLFFISLAYIAISIDASGLIRWLSLKVLQKGGSRGHLLYFYLYCFFFSLASFIGNDPIILSGTPFLAYMTRVSANIRDPEAWIFTQFSVANVASAILVSSNPTNLVLSGAFNIKFIVYTANMIVPVVVTAILYFPFLLYYVFRDDALIPKKIQMHELPPGERKTPVNPNVPFSKGIAPEDEDKDTEEARLLSLEEVINPYLDKRSAIFSASIMAVTLVAILAVNASSKEEHPVFWITLPAAVIVFTWDMSWGWKHRHETRKVAAEGRRKIEERKREDAREIFNEKDGQREDVAVDGQLSSQQKVEQSADARPIPDSDPCDYDSSTATGTETKSDSSLSHDKPVHDTPDANEAAETRGNGEADEKVEAVAYEGRTKRRTDLETLMAERWVWARDTFPTATSVLSHLPFPLVPFSLCMFVLVQALVSRGWVTVFAWGWNDWVQKTGTVGAIGGMAFISVLLCNFAGTNIGTTILLARVVQEWVSIHETSGNYISQRTFWATIYSMALGLNYGAFSTAFSASLAGLLWRSILAAKGIPVSARRFAIVNVRLIAFTMVVGCAVLIGEVYIVRKDVPYRMQSSAGGG